MTPHPDTYISRAGAGGVRSARPLLQAGASQVSAPREQEAAAREGLREAQTHRRGSRGLPGLLPQPSLRGLGVRGWIGGHGPSAHGPGLA